MIGASNRKKHQQWQHPTCLHGNSVEMALYQV